VEANTESRADRLEALSQRLNRPAASLRAFASQASLRAFASLSSEELATLSASLDTALSARRAALDHALERLLPWPLHRFVLPWLRR
jgi:hypothetical protein